MPKDLDDCFLEINKMLHPDFIEELKSGKIESADCHFGLGMWMRNNWGLWSESKLAKYFHERKLYHPDSISGIIIDSYISKLRNEPFNPEEIIGVAAYQEQRYKNLTDAPEDILDPETNGTVTIVDSKTMYYFDEDDDMKNWTIIHLGINKKTNETWFYEYDRGWYKPTEDDLKRAEKRTGAVNTIGKNNTLINK
jgi:hypothetical protein